MQQLVNISDINSLTSFEFEAACREYTHYAYLENNTALCRILTKYKIYIDTRDASMSPHLIMDGYWETWLTQCLARIIKPGDICIDIGANFGYYSILMSALSGTGQTIAVEPNPRICQLLRATASIHPHRFEVIEAALSNKSGKVTLSVPDNYFGDGSIINRTDRGPVRGTKKKVSALTLDEMVQQLNLPKVDVVKMDVEGVEPLIFEGMQQTIERNPGIKIILEYSPFIYADTIPFTEYLFARFTVHRIKDADQAVALDASAIADLVQLKDHTDLYLQRK